VKTDEQRIFLQAIIKIYDAIADYMLRYADAARVAGMEALSASLVKAATERPQDFRTALQLLWIVALIDCAYITPNPTLTLGRLDQILYPLYADDLASGRMTCEEARALITDYYCKHNLIMGRGEHQVGDAKNSTTFQRICNFDAPQYLLLAGTDGQGKDAVKTFLQNNPDIAETVEAQVRENLWKLQPGSKATARAAERPVAVSADDFNDED
jgi:hypothetical protein